MNCCQRIKAYIGYTQDEEWYVVMISNETISCECHHLIEFRVKQPLTTEEWVQQWQQGEQAFFLNNEIKVEWEYDISNLIQNKNCKKIIGKTMHPS